MRHRPDEVAEELAPAGRLSEATTHGLAEYHGAIVGPELVILIIVLVVVVFWRGPSTLPKLGEALGKAVKGARDNMPDSKDDEPLIRTRPVDPTDAGPRSGS